MSTRSRGFLSWGVVVVDVVVVVVEKEEEERDRSTWGLPACCYRPRSSPRKFLRRTGAGMVGISK